MLLAPNATTVSEEQLEKTVLALVAGVWIDSGLLTSPTTRMIHKWGLYDLPDGR